MSALGKLVFTGALLCARHFTTLFHLVFADAGFFHVLMAWNAFLPSRKTIRFSFKV